VAIAYGGNSALVTSTAGTVTPTLPAGTTSGDLLIMHVAHGGTATMSAPAGWTLGTSVQISTTHRQHSFWRFAGAGETNPTFTSTVTTNGMWGVLTRWTGVPVSANPFNAGGAPTGATGSGAAMTGATMTPTAAGCMAVWFWCQSDNGTTSTVDNSASVAFSGSSYDSVVGLDSNQSAGFKLMPTAVATGVTTMTSASGAAWSCIRMLLDPTLATAPISASDSITITDSAKVGIPATDTLTITDEARVGEPIPASDAITVTENLAIAGSLNVSDPVTVTDTLGIVGSLSAADSLAITDVPKVGPKGTDSLAISDQISSLVGHLGVTDPITISDGAAIETLFGDLVIVLFGVDPDTGALIPLPDYKTFTVSRERNSAGSISLTYPVDGLNFNVLRDTITADRDLEIEVWTIGSSTNAMRGFLQEASGDDVVEDRTWTFAGGFAEILLGEAVAWPAPIITITTVVTTTKVDDTHYTVVTKTTTASSAGGPAVTTTVTTTASSGTEGTTTSSKSTNGDLEFEAVTPGEFATFLVDQAQDRGGLDGLTVGFTATHDSAGVAWPDVFTSKFSPGSRYDSMLQRLVDFGLAEWGVTWTGTSYRLDLWVIFGRGVDRTTGPRPIVLRKARNLTDAPRKWSVRDAGTALLAAGGEGVYEDTADVDALARRGRRIERSASANNLTDPAAVQAFAQNQLHLLAVGRLEITHGIVFAGGEPRPVIAFDIGDWVYSQSSGGLERLRVVQWTLSVDSDQGPSGTVTLNDTITDWLSRLKAALDNLTSGDTVVGTSTSSGGQDFSTPLPPEVLSADSIAFLDGTLGVRAAVTVAWDPPVLNTDGTVITDMAGFNVQFALATAPDVWNAGITVNSGTADHATFTAPAGQTITIRVNAVDRQGNTSVWSDPPFPITTASDDIPPPVPSAAVVSEFLGTVRISWDGLTADAAVMTEAAIDFDHVEVHLSAGSLFTPDDTTLVGRMFGRGTFTVTDLPYGVTQYARFVAVDWSNNKSAASAQGSATPAQVVSADVFDGAIGTAKLADAAITTAKINDLAVNDAKIGSLSVGKLTAGSLTVDVILAGGGIKTATTGTRLEADSGGLRLYNGVNVVVDLKTSNGSALVVGEFRTSLTGQRIVFNPGGALADTMNFYPSAAGDFARIMSRTAPLDGTAAILIDGGAANGTARGRVGAYKSEAFISYVTGDSGGDTSAGFSRTAVTCRSSDIGVWAQTRILFQKYSGSTLLSGSNLEIKWVAGSTSSNTPMLSAFDADAGIKLDDTFICGTNAAGNTFYAFKGNAFIVSSGQDVKTDIEPLRGAMAMARAATVRRYRYRAEVAQHGRKARVRYGVLAEEMPAELVQMTPAVTRTGLEKSLNIADLVGLNHAALIEHADDTDGRFAALEQRLAALEGGLS
jgi:hypothetical protein